MRIFLAQINENIVLELQRTEEKKNRIRFRIDFVNHILIKAIEIPSIEVISLIANTILNLFSFIIHVY